jgi:hypothetical protein
MAPAQRLLSTVLVLGVLAGACGDGAPAPKNRVVPITLDQMLRSYAEHPGRADREYGGRVFELEARVSAVGRDARGHPVVELRGEAESGGALCSAAGDDPRLAALPVAAVAHLRGTVVGIKSGSAIVVLSHCARVE